MSTGIEAVAAILTGNSVLLGPIVVDPNNSDEWYFTVAHGDHGAERFEIMRLDCPEGREFAEMARGSLAMALAGSRRGVVMIDLDDELEMARFAARFWPGTQSAKLLALVESERSDVRH